MTLAGEMFPVRLDFYIHRWSFLHFYRQDQCKGQARWPLQPRRCDVAVTFWGVVENCRVAAQVVVHRGPQPKYDFWTCHPSQLHNEHCLLRSGVERNSLLL